MSESNNTTQHERRNLAYFWSITAAGLLWYILIKYGGEKEILTLIIGIISGTLLGGIFGVYFAGVVTNKPTSSATTESGDVNVNSTETTPEAPIT